MSACSCDAFENEAGPKHDRGCDFFEPCAPGCPDCETEELIFDRFLTQPGPRQLGIKGRKLAAFDLMPFDALWEVAEVLGWGASNRGDSARNWEKGLVAGDLVAGIIRHVSQWAAGEELDEETGKSHLSHAACLLLFARALQLRGKLVDDRPPAFGPLRSVKLD